MAHTLISDVYVPEVYASYTAVDGPEKSAVFQSGVAVADNTLAALFSEGGRIAELPFWKDLDASSEPDYGTDSSSDIATPVKVTTGTMVARMASLNKPYSAADLASELAGSDALQHVRNRFGTYWMRQWQRRMIATLQGVIADNVANDSSDMVSDISASTNGAVTTASLFSREAFTGAAFTSGDHFDNYSAIAVHSVVYKRMVDNDDITMIPDSQGNLTIPTFMGRAVIVDDGLPVVAASGSSPSDNAPKYTSYLMGSGLIGFGERTPRVPSEVSREALQGNAAGIEVIIERKSWVLHPFGMEFTSTTLTKGNATWSDLRTANNWDRVVDRKSVPLAALITNG